MIRLLSVMLAVAALSSAAAAADIYRWVDENGRVQLSDTVPDKYKATAVRVDSRQFELSPAQRSEAQRRLDREKAALAEQPRASAPGRNRAAGIGAGNASPAPGADCEALQQRYRES